jgi:hypothetical protein
VDDYKAYSERRNGITKNSLCRRWGATLGVAQKDPTGVCVDRAVGRLVQAFDNAHELALSAHFLNETEDGSIIAKTQQLQALCPEYVILRPVLADGFITRKRNKAASSSDVKPPAFTAQHKRKRQPSVPRSVEQVSAQRNVQGNLMHLGGDISSITADANGKGKAVFRENLTPGLPDSTPKTARTSMPSEPEHHAASHEAGPASVPGYRRFHDRHHDERNAGEKSLEQLQLERDILRYKALERDPEFFKVYEMKALEVQRMELEIKGRKGELDLLLARLREGHNDTA